MSKSFQDCARRLRLAGDTFQDLRCIIYHGIDVPWGDLDTEFGNTFGQCSFRTLLNSRDFWNSAFYFKDEVDPLGAFYRRRSATEITPKQSRRRRLARNRLEALSADALWLVDGVGFTKIPGTEGIEFGNFIGSKHTWLWLLYLAAWSCPPGSILRAGKYYPTQLMTRVRLRKQREEEVGYGDSYKGFEKFAEAQKAIRERNRAIGKQKREEEWHECYNSVCEEAESRLAKSEFMSLMPIDPFTASASLLDLIIAGGDLLPSNTQPVLQSPTENDHWSAPMSKAEIARRITGKRTARFREVQPFLAKHGLQKISPNKWIVRLDEMDENTRTKLEGKT